MTGERPDVDLLLENGSENPKRIFAALNVQPTKPNKMLLYCPKKHMPSSASDMQDWRSPTSKKR